MPELCLRRPVATTTCALAALVLGCVSLARLPVEYLPETEGSSLTVNVSYPASAPQEVERLIARPLEEELASLQGLESIASTSQASGASVRLELETGTDMDAVALEVRERIDRARPFLPSDVGRIEFRRWKSTDRPVLRCRVAPAAGTSHAALQRFIDEVLVARLGRLPGVGNVEVNGLARRRVLVEADRDALAQAKLTTADVARTLRLRNRNVSAGQLSTDSRVMSVRVLGELGSAEAVAALPLGVGNLRLGSVATVTEELERLPRVRRLNGRPAITLRVSKASGANSVQVCEGIKAELDAIRELPIAEGFEVLVFSDDSNRIWTRLTNLLFSGLYGGGLLCMVLFLFLRELRSTLIVSATIPLSVVLTFGILFVVRQLGGTITINVVSMMGLILGIGLVVDNGIVVLENIVRLRDAGLSPKEAAARGASEVSGAITASMITSIIVFVPLLLATSGGRLWTRPLGVVVCASVFSSLWVALTIVPLMASRLLPARPQQEAAPKPRLLWYRKLLGGTLRFRWLVLLIVLPLCSWQIYLFFTNVERSWGGGDSEREIEVKIDVPRSYSEEARHALFARLEGILLDPKNKADLDLATLTADYKTSAEAEAGGRRRRWRGDNDELELVLNSTGPGERRSVAEVRERLRQLLPEIPGVILRLGASRRMGGGGGRSVRVLVSGRSSDALLGPAQQVADALKAVPGVEDVTLSAEQTGAGLELRPRRDLGSRYGVTPGDIGETVAASLSERAVTRLRASTRELDVILRLQDEDRANLKNLLATPVPREEGSLPVGALTSVQRRPSPRQIQREDRRAVLVVEASVLEGSEMRTVTQRAEETLATLSLGRGVSTRLDKQVRRWRRDESQSSGSTLLAFVLVLMVLSALFESYVDAFTIAMTVPFALVGVAWAFWATDTHLDSMAWIGLMILIGIVVNHGIVLVDRLRRLQREGATQREALLQSGQDRLRPIVMTAATTVLGLGPIVAQHLLPEVFSADSGAQVYGPIGLAVAAGLVVSTALTLLVLPAVLSVSLDARALVQRLSARLSGDAR